MRYFSTIDKDKKPADYFSKFIFDLIMVHPITGFMSASESGLLISGMAGANFYLSEDILLNANYSINYLGNSYYENSLAHNINIGIGFQLD